MPLKKTNEPAFSNGTEFQMWMGANCDRCIKASHYNEKTETYTAYLCAIQRDIDFQMACDEPISVYTKTVCDDYTLNGKSCPYIKTERKPVPRKPQVTRTDGTGQLSLF